LRFIGPPVSEGKMRSLISGCLRQGNPMRAVLNVKTTEYGTIHEADCHHIGAPAESRASVGHTHVG
jgi:hypothetical protein